MINIHSICVDDCYTHDSTVVLNLGTSAMNAFFAKEEKKKETANKNVTQILMRQPFNLNCVRYAVYVYACAQIHYLLLFFFLCKRRHISTRHNRNYMEYL